MPSKYRINGANIGLTLCALLLNKPIAVRSKPPKSFFLRRGRPSWPARHELVSNGRYSEGPTRLPAGLRPRQRTQSSPTGHHESGARGQLPLPDAEFPGRPKDFERATQMARSARPRRISGFGEQSGQPLPPHGRTGEGSPGRAGRRWRDKRDRLMESRTEDCSFRRPTRWRNWIAFRRRSRSICRQSGR